MATVESKPKTPTMNEITSQVQDIIRDCLEQGFDDDTISATLMGMDFGEEDKMMGYRLAMDEKDIQANEAKNLANSYKDLAKPYTDRAKSLEDERKRMTWPLLNYFKMRNIEKIKGAYGTFFISKNPDKLHIDKDKVPPQFLKRQVSYTIDETAIKEYLKSLPEGEKADFAWFESGTELVKLRK